MNGIEVRGKNIYHMRGDTGIIDIDMRAYGFDFPFREGDSAVFSVKKKMTDKGYVLQKHADPNGMFVFFPEDTRLLEPGVYWYDIQVTFKEGQVLTVMGPAQYRLLADVTV